MNTLDFSLLLAQFNTDAHLVAHTDTIEIGPDEHIYALTTSDGIFYIYEIDFIENLKQVKAAIEAQVDTDVTLIKAKSPLDWSNSGPVQATSLYVQPDDLETIVQYLNDQHGSKPYYFTLLAKA